MSAKPKKEMPRFDFLISFIFVGVLENDPIAVRSMKHLVYVLSYKSKNINISNN